MRPRTLSEEEDNEDNSDYLIMGLEESYEFKFEKFENVSKKSNLDLPNTKNEKEVEEATNFDSDSEVNFQFDFSSESEGEREIKRKEQRK